MVRISLGILRVHAPLVSIARKFWKMSILLADGEDLEKMPYSMSRIGGRDAGVQSISYLEGNIVSESV